MKKVAEVSGISFTQLSMIERGHSPVPARRHWARLVVAIPGLTLEALAAGCDATLVADGVRELAQRREYYGLPPGGVL